MSRENLASLRALADQGRDELKSQLQVGIDGCEGGLGPRLGSELRNGVRHS